MSGDFLDVPTKRGGGRSLARLLWEEGRFVFLALWLLAYTRPSSIAHLERGAQLVVDERSCQRQVQFCSWHRPNPSLLRRFFPLCEPTSLLVSVRSPVQISKLPVVYSHIVELLLLPPHVRSTPPHFASINQHFRFPPPFGSLSSCPEQHSITIRHNIMLHILSFLLLTHLRLLSSSPGKYLGTLLCSFSLFACSPF